MKRMKMWEGLLPHLLWRDRSRVCVDPHAAKYDQALASAAICRLRRWSLGAAYQLDRREDPVLRTRPGRSAISPGLCFSAIAGLLNLVFANSPIISGPETFGDCEAVKRWRSSTYTYVLAILAETIHEF